MDDLVKKARFLLAHNLVKRESENLWDVQDNIVRFIKNPGRSFFTCTCTNHVKFCKESPMCCHKFAVIQFGFNNQFKEKVMKVVDLYKKFNEVSKEMKTILFIQELEDLIRFI